MLLAQKRCGVAQATPAPCHPEQSEGSKLAPDKGVPGKQQLRRYELKPESDSFPGSRCFPQAKGGRSA